MSGKAECSRRAWMRSVLVFVLLALPTAAQFTPDPFDSVLVVYWLDAHTAGSFSASDSQSSSFWHGWEGRDSITLTPERNSFPECNDFSGPDDARVVVKAAGSVRGLFVFLDIRDDTWTEHGTYRDGDIDHASTFHALLSSESIAACTDCLLGLYYSALTEETKQIQPLLSGPQAMPDTFSFGYSDNNLWGGWHPFVLANRDAKEALTMAIEGIVSAPDHRQVEYLIPWSLFPMRTLLGGPPDTTTGVVPARAERRAFAVSYRDRDNAEPDSSWLGWPGKDPWFGHYWGDMVFGPGFPEQPTPVTALATQPVRHSLSPPGHQPAYPTKCFDILGREIRANRPHAGRCLLLWDGGAARVRMRIGTTTPGQVPRETAP
ncbi:MAG: hypothetical protein GF331_25750 [Chitinivibrionales bacterium]|nr:hypothetical protein [Chitinivibrionales bacterium]